jgi:hypothetical protein
MNTIIKKNWKIFLAFFVPLVVVNVLDFYLLIIVDQYSKVLHAIGSMSYVPAFFIFGACIDRPCDNAVWFAPVFFTTAIVLMPVVWGVIGVGIVRLLQMIRSRLLRT